MILCFNKKPNGHIAHLRKGNGLLFEKKLIHFNDQRICFAKFSWNLPSDSEEDF